MKPCDATTDDGRTLTVRVPLTLRKRGGRKQVALPEGATWGAPRARIDNTMVKAIARAHRWRRLLESGQFTSVTDLADDEKINHSYLCRVLRLTLLAPDIVEAILDGTQTSAVTLANLMQAFPGEWGKQRRALGPTTPEVTGLNPIPQGPEAEAGPWKCLPSPLYRLPGRRRKRF